MTRPVKIIFCPPFKELIVSLPSGRWDDDVREALEWQEAWTLGSGLGEGNEWNFMAVGAQADHAASASVSSSFPTCEIPLSSVTSDQWAVAAFHCEEGKSGR